MLGGVEIHCKCRGPKVLERRGRFEEERDDLVVIDKLWKLMSTRQIEGDRVPAQLFRVTKLQNKDYQHPAPTWEMAYDTIKSK